MTYCNEQAKFVCNSYFICVATSLFIEFQGLYFVKSLTFKQDIVNSFIWRCVICAYCVDPFDVVVSYSICPSELKNCTLGLSVACVYNLFWGFPDCMSVHILSTLNDLSQLMGVDIIKTYWQFKWIIVSLRFLICKVYST